MFAFSQDETALILELPPILIAAWQVVSGAAV